MLLYKFGCPHFNEIFEQAGMKTPKYLLPMNSIINVFILSYVYFIKTFKLRLEPLFFYLAILGFQLNLLKLL